ncbi:MAG: dihydrodipicolinate synthase family protein [Bacillota bacterium]
MSKIYASLITPYDGEKHIDFKIMEDIVDLNMENGIKNYFVGGNLSEIVALSWEERKMLYKRALEIIPTDGDVILDISTGLYKASIDFIEFLEQEKRDFEYAVSVPIQVGFSNHSEDYLNYAKLIIDRVDRPVYLELIPSIFVEERAVKLFKDMTRIENVKGLMATPELGMDPNLNHLDALKDLSGGLDMICEADEFFLSVINEKVDAVVSKYINVIPHCFNVINDNFKDDKKEAAVYFQENINSIIKECQKYGDVQSIKYLLKQKGIDAGGCRPPYRQLSREAEEKLDKLKI